MQVQRTYPAGVWQRGLVMALLGLVAFVLAACSGGSDPFGKDAPTTAPPKGKTPPAIIVRSIGGMPGDLARQLKVALAVSAGQHDIGIVEGDLPGGTFTLEGVFSPQPGSVSYQWTLRDTKGYVVDQPSGQATAAAGGADPWSGVDSKVLQQIADDTANFLAQKLAAMGYATRLSSLVTPPTETFAMAGPGASQEIDYETLNGPGAIDPASLVAPADMLPDEPVAEVTPEEPTAQVAEAPSSEPQAKDGPAKPVIKAVAVVPVTGAPGRGNAELTKAMRDTLTAAGWPVLAAPRADALTIAGRVKLAPGEGGNQTVKVSWVVSHPQGSELGDIRQSNAVPAGSLDAGFGAAAVAVAEAAATGIFDLIKTYR